MTEQNFEQMRAAMVASQLRTTGVSDPRVVAAMAEVSRERFVAEADRALAYLDRAMPLGGGRAMPSPMVLGRLLTEARIASSERMLVIGAGSGYAATVAVRLAASVTALEDEGIASAAAAAPAIAWVRGPLDEGWSADAPYDVILFDGAIERVPPAIVAQLAEGGRLATPLIERGVTRLALGRKAGGAFGLRAFADADAPRLPGFSEPATFRF